MHTINRNSIIVYHLFFDHIYLRFHSLFHSVMFISLHIYDSPSSALTFYIFRYLQFINDLLVFGFHTHRVPLCLYEIQFATFLFCFVGYVWIVGYVEYAMQYPFSLVFFSISTISIALRYIHFD